MGCGCSNVGAGITGPAPTPVAPVPNVLDATELGGALDFSGTYTPASPSAPTVAGVAAPSDPVTLLQADAAKFPVWSALNPYRQYPAVKPGILPPAAGGMPYRRFRPGGNRRHAHHLLAVGIVLVLLIIFWG